MNILDTLLYFLTHPFMCLFYGLFAHFGVKITAAYAHDTGKVPCITDYWKKHPWQTSLSISGAMAGYAMFAHFPDFVNMSPEIQNVVRVNAVGMGFMADRVFDAVGKKAEQKIDNFRSTGP